MFVVVGSGTLVYHVTEGWGWVDSLYFTVITLTTIGYGDLSPSKPGTKLFTVVLVLVGIGLLVSLIERVARYAAEAQAARQGAPQRRLDQRLYFDRTHRREVMRDGVPVVTAVG